MTTYSSILAWRIPWTAEPGGLQSMGSQRVGHDGVTNTITSTFQYRSLHCVEKSSLCSIVGSWQLSVLCLVGDIYQPQYPSYPLPFPLVLQCSLQHHLQQPGHGHNLNIIKREMKKEDAVHIYNKILLSHKKE